MTAFALHLPERQGVTRWVIAAAAILALHAAIVVLAVIWAARRPASVPSIPPAIVVTLAPTANSAPQIQDQDLAVGPTMQQTEAAPPEPPKIEDEPVERVEQPPSPPQRADIMLPQAEPKPVERPKPAFRPPAPETRAPQKNDHVGEFSQAGSNAYNALVFGHLQKFKRYPQAARGKSGTVLVRFVLSRDGTVVESTVARSSGNDVLDREAIEILHRASPFPVFPVAKPGAQDVYTAPISFAR